MGGTSSTGCPRLHSQKVGIVISTILASIANNFAILFPQYWAQFEFTGTAPTVPFFYGPKFLTQQDAPPKIVVVLGAEPFQGAEIHSTMPNAQPRELSRIMTRMHFYLWGMGSNLPTWVASQAQNLLDDTGPTAANQNGYWFQATTAGTTGAIEPAWTGSLGATVSDGSVVWTNMGLVNDFRIYDTDVTDLMRTVMAATMHYTLVGSFKPVSGTWYDKSDLLVMDGTTNRVSFDVLIPIPDLAPTTAIINSTILDAQITLLF
jgi:hypothetical protein